MTETVERPDVRDAIAVIDRGLSELRTREIVPASEVADLLLDLRLLLATHEASQPQVEPVP